MAGYQVQKHDHTGLVSHPGPFSRWPRGGWHEVARPSTPKGVPKRHRSGLLQQTGHENIPACMRIVDPETGRSYVEKRRVRYNERSAARADVFLPSLAPQACVRAFQSIPS
jgi:hypothetical protein